VNVTDTHTETEHQLIKLVKSWPPHRGWSVSSAGVEALQTKCLSTLLGVPENEQPLRNL